MKIERIFILLLAVLVGFCSGIMTANLLEWQYFLTPVIASVSVLFGTTVALKNMEQNRKHELIKRTFEKISQCPPIGEALFDARVTMNNIIVEHRLYDFYDNHQRIIVALRDLPAEVATLIVQYLEHYESFLFGIEKGLYDMDLLSDSVEDTVVAVWRDFWPVARQAQLLSQTDFVVSTRKPYEYLEKSAIAHYNGTIEELIMPSGRYRRIHPQGT